MNGAQLLSAYRLRAKFLLLSVLPACLIACSTPLNVSSNSTTVKQISKVGEGVEVQPKVENPSKRDVEIVEAETYNVIIDRLSNAAKRSVHLYWKQENLSLYREDIRKAITDRIGNPKYFLNLLKHRKQIVQMLKQGCISDAYRYSPNNQVIIRQLKLYQDRVGYSIWKVRDGQYLVSLICGHGMSLLDNVVFLVTEIDKEPNIKALRLMGVTRNKQTGEFQFRPAWSTIMFGSFGPAFDVETGILSIETKGNGSGQLRSSWKYKIENDDFVLLEFRNRGWDYKGSDIPRIYP
jgi:hypothetical protein